MAKPARKKTKKTTKQAARSKPAADPGESNGAGRRTHEVFGIITLAAALLIGPSVLSVQFGDGLLMGPFGQTVGGVLNWALGLTAHILVAALLLTALKIFASALGINKGPGDSIPTMWRRRIGIVFALVSGSMLLHLAGRPNQLGDASLGGALGELLAELSCSLLSTPGSWIVTIAGLALAVVLTTNFSWVRALAGLWTTTGQSVQAMDAPSRWAQLKERIRLAGQWVVEQLAHPHRKTLPDAGGAAALPPVVRIDLSGHLDAHDETATGTDPLQREVQPDLPADLEIGRKSRLTQDGPEETPPPLVIHGAASDKPKRKRTNKKASAIESESQGHEDEAALDGDQLAAALNTQPEAKAETEESVTRSDPEPTAPESTLTIVQQTFDGGEEEIELEDKEVDDPNGDGFVLNEGTYRPPPLSLLTIHNTETTAIDEEAIQKQAARLTEALRHYKIFGTVTEVHPGPVVTMYEFVPAPGTRISKIASLSNDLAMSLHALRVRIVAPIPGRGAVGIEVPNERRETVSFREIVGDKAFLKNKKARLAMALGKTISGAPAVMDLAKMPHLLVAGATGAGKSVSVNAMICSLLMRYSPEEVRLIMIDPKILELSGYNGIPHLLLPVVTDPKPANISLRWAVAEMERRYQKLADVGARDIIGYNRKVDKKIADAEEARQQELPLSQLSTIEEAQPSKISLVHKNADGSEHVEEISTESDGGEVKDVVVPSAETEARAAAVAAQKADPNLKRMPYLVVVIDEFADLMTVASKEVETSVARLAQKARACGIHLILATQRPSVDVITGLIKANFPSRIAFQVASNHDSKTILNSPGAENLLGAGDMLVLDRGAEMRRLHGAYISDDEIQAIIDWIKEQGRPIYNMDILKVPEEEENQGVDEDEPQDPLYDQAVSLVAETRQASISMVQRRLRIGYNRAARLVEQMEREGIVGPPDGVRGREVLIQNHSE